MAIQVFCECGNAMSVRPELGGKKVKCKSCGSVLRIPEVPLDESAEAPPEALTLKKDPEKPKAEKSSRDEKPADKPAAKEKPAERAAILNDSSDPESKGDYEV